MADIEGVKVWLRLINEFPIDYIALQICRLFEPKPEQKPEPLEKLVVELKDGMYHGEPKPDLIGAIKSADKELKGK